MPSTLVVSLAIAAPSALARGGQDTWVGGTCRGGATSSLRLKSHHGRIEVEFEVRRRRSGETWRVVLVHERRVSWRGNARTHGSSGSFRVRRSIPDFGGPDAVSLRASGPRGITCEASATLRG